jgi:hypothetical protein
VILGDIERHDAVTLEQTLEQKTNMLLPRYYMLKVSDFYEKIRFQPMKVCEDMKFEELFVKIFFVFVFNDTL